MKMAQTIQHFDTSLFVWVRQRKSQRVLVRIAREISRTADGPLYLVFMLLVAATRQPLETTLLTCLFFGFVVERLIYWVTKNCCKRSRPQAALNIPSFIVPSDKFSFPSGHTSAAFFAATVIGGFFSPAAPFLFFWAASVGMARVVLGVHFPTDTLVGALIGSVLGLLSLEILAA